jgi:dihydrofolate reductase
MGVPRAHLARLNRGIAGGGRLGERTVAVNAGDVGSQVLAAGLVDEVAMDVVPVVFGSGKRYFGSIDGQHLLEDPHVVIWRIPTWSSRATGCYT